MVPWEVPSQKGRTADRSSLRHSEERWREAFPLPSRFCESGLHKDLELTIPPCKSHS